MFYKNGKPSLIDGKTGWTLVRPVQCKTNLIWVNQFNGKTSNQPVHLKRNV
jgi:hypothetical protein